MRKAIMLAVLAVAVLFASCDRPEEMALEDLYDFEAAGAAEILALARYQPFPGYDAVLPGRMGGTWNASSISEPRTFNFLVGGGDATTNDINLMTLDFLANYCPITREWVPRSAAERFWYVINDDGTMDVFYTLRDNLYWSYFQNTRPRVRVTSADAVFWHNNIVGDVRMAAPGYSAQLVQMPDGSMVQRTAHIVDERTFFIRIPRVVANPIFTTNFAFGPRHHFEPAYQRGGVDEVRSIFNLGEDPRLMPSMGAYFITEYSPGHRVVLTRNPDFWDGSRFFPEQHIIHIVPDQTTQFLLFQQGQLELYAMRAEDVDVLVRNQVDWTVYHNDGLQGSGRLWSFNQNPQNRGEPWYDWFTQTAFRQAMSSMTNRDRINLQVHRGMSQSMLWWFPPANQFYNPNLRLEFTYNPARALQLLESIGMRRDSAGIMRDDQGRQVRFDLAFPAGVTVWEDLSSVLIDELSQIGIVVDSRPTEFQALVEQLMTSFDWQTLLIGITGGPTFPTQGTNVWLSNGNLHLWHPFQEEGTATGWEARKDYLFRAGMFEPRYEYARPLWDEFQEIMLYQQPLVWLDRPILFRGLNNRWDQRNFFFDNTSHTHRSEFVFSN